MKLPLLILASASLAFPLSARFIDGAVFFGGVWEAVGGSGPTDIAGATGIDVLGDTVSVLATLGDFPAPSSALAATYADFSFDPPSTPITPLWTLSDGITDVSFEFDLGSIVVESQTATALVLTGAGVVTSSDPLLDPTPFLWSFSGDTTNFEFNAFSSTSSTIPEPSALGLLGFGALSLLLVARRRC